MTNAVSGGVKVTLRLEGLVVLIASAAAHSRFGAGWGVFALCFLAPDLSFVGYLGGPRLGAAVYNAAHSYAGAVIVLSVALATPSPVMLSAGLIWCAHIGFDRALGYGLKYARGFAFTHLGPAGRATEAARG